MESTQRHRLAEAAADSIAGGRWTARHGVGGWYVEDDAGRVVCETAHSSVAAHIAANDPASVVEQGTAANYEPARDASGNAIYLDADDRVVDLPSFIAPPRGWRPLLLRTPSYPPKLSPPTPHP